MSEAVTIQDVAERAQVSVASVSRVYNGHPQVGTDMRERVLKAAADLGYAGPRSGGVKERAFLSRPTPPLKEIAFLFGVRNEAAPVNAFWSHLLAGAEQEARRQGLKLIYRVIGGLAGRPEALLSDLRQMGSDGLLLVGPVGEDVADLLSRSGYTVALVDNHLPGCPIDSVVGDNLEGARVAVRHLMDAGHTRIGYIGGAVPAGDHSGARPAIYTIAQREIGYRMALIEGRLPVEDALCEWGNDDLDMEGGYDACRRMLRRGARFSALFCANDATAIGAMRALKDSGRKVPEDVSVIGFDDIEVAAHLSPSLTSVCVPKEAMGRAAVKALLARALDPPSLPVRVVLPVELVIRHSVKGATREEG
jgi:DNA-binding LacI/PurR family transcriptional regulator